MRKIISLMLVFSLMAPFFVHETAFSANFSVSAASAIVIEADTGRVVYEKNADEKRAMASTTKIMTALLTIEAGDLDREFVVDSTAIKVEGTSMGLREGDRVSRRDLLYGILLPSGNDAANAAAVSVSGSISKFVEKMNKKAEQLGLENTHFVTPSGLDAEGHYTTARDLARLAAHAMKNELFREIVSCSHKTVEFGNPPYPRTLYNSNKMLSRYDGAIGIKTGFTDNARRCLVSAAERGGVTLVAVTLNAPDDWNDHEKMLDFGFEQVKLREVDVSCEGRVSVAGSGKSAGVYAEKTVIPLSDADHKRLERRILLPRMVYGDVKIGQKLGEIEFLLDGKVIKTAPLFAKNDVKIQEKGLNLFQKILGFFGIFV